MAKEYINSSYRKIIDSETRSNESYKEYEINYDLIEENMTELLLKNKKLLNNEVTEFIYNDEVFANQVTNLITMFKKRYNNKNINIFDKVAIYKFSEDNKNNSYLSKTMINDFIELIRYLNDKRKDNTDKTKDNNKENDMNITEETKIYEIVEKLKDTFSNNFIRIFENNEGLTIDKTCEIFLYYLKLIFDMVKYELKNYQNELDNKSKEFIKDYYLKNHLITKKDFACAIRLFTTLVLFLEEDKEKKINSNRNNLINYLKGTDLWNSDIYSNDDFNKNLNELKLFNVQISQIISLYEVLGKDIEDNFCEDVKVQIEKEEESKKKVEPLVEENINNGNDNDNNYDDDDDVDMFAGNNEDSNDDGDRN